jgi:competence protein ComEA
VQKPGVYELKSGSRINDLLILAGGLSAEASREWVSQNMNLAQKLTDGAKVYIPVKPETRNSQLANRQTANAKININTASASQLDTLWGIGPATAQKVISGRPYQAIEELLTRKIVKSNVWEAIRDKITVY